MTKTNTILDLLFGWGRKASKCKKLIRDVQGTLRWLKDNQRSAVKKSRNDAKQLIVRGHYQEAFDMAGKIYKDEGMIEIYDLLHAYCEFVAVKLPYICKHMDCPDDINEAVSSLIFASVRFQVPYLMSLTSLLGERYGRRFVKIATKLLPGNLVCPEIIDVRYAEYSSVPDYIKHRLLNEIASIAPIPEEDRPWLEELQVMRRSISDFDQKRSSLSDIYGARDEVEKGKPVHMVEVQSYSSSDASDEEESMEFSEDPLENVEVLKFVQTYSDDSSEYSASESELETSVYSSEEEIESSPENKDGFVKDQSSTSELVTSTAQSPEEVIYLDDTEEDVLFRSELFSNSATAKAYSNLDECIPSRRSVNNRRSSIDRWRSRMTSQENIIDYQSAMYYGRPVILTA